MPGSVALSVASTVLPHQLCAAWTLEYAWPVSVSEGYPDGRRQVRTDGSVARSVWRQSRKLTYTEFAALKAFYDARKGGYEAFYFYPRTADYDASGVSTTGRYKVRFDGSLEQQYEIARYVLSLKLVEVA